MGGPRQVGKTTFALGLLGTTADERHPPYGQGAVQVLRGMASITAIRERLDAEDADKVELDAMGAEGTEISVPGARLGAYRRARDDQAPVLVTIGDDRKH